jgi:hypothetical protein
MEQKFRYDLKAFLFEQINVRHTLVLILSREAECHGPAFKPGMNVLFMEQFEF